MPGITNPSADICPHAFIPDQYFFKVCMHVCVYICAYDELVSSTNSYVYYTWPCIWYVCMYACMLWVKSIADISPHAFIPDQYFFKVCMYVCMYAHLCMHVYIYIYIYIYIYTHKHTCKWIGGPLWYTRTRRNTHTHAHIHTYIRTGDHELDDHFDVHGPTETHIHTQSHTQAHTYIHTFIHSGDHALDDHIDVYGPAETHTHTHTYIHTYIHTFRWPRIGWPDWCIQTHRNTHTHTHAHTYIHTYIQVTTNWMTILMYADSQRETDRWVDAFQTIGTYTHTHHMHTCKSTTSWCMRIHKERQTAGLMPSRP